MQLFGLTRHRMLGFVYMDLTIKVKDCQISLRQNWIVCWLTSSIGCGIKPEDTILTIKIASKYVMPFVNHLAASRWRAWISCSVCSYCFLSWLFPFFTWMLLCPSPLLLLPTWLSWHSHVDASSILQTFILSSWYYPGTANWPRKVLLQMTCKPHSVVYCFRIQNCTG